MICAAEPDCFMTKVVKKLSFRRGNRDRHRRHDRRRHIRVLGLAIAVAGHAVALTLAGGGIIALLTGLFYAHLGLAFRSDGGSFTYIERAFAAPAIAGIAGWLLIVGYIGTLALYATAFDDYGAALLRESGIAALQPGMLATLVLTAFLGINLVGAKVSGRIELAVVAAKLAILTLFAAVGIFGVSMSHFTPVFDMAWSPRSARSR